MQYNTDVNEMSIKINEGPVDYRVHNALEKVSKSGNEMIKLILKVRDEAGNTDYVHDYLVSNNKAKWKIKQFCDSNKLDFENGVLDPNDCIGQRGTCDVKYEHYNGYDNLKVKQYHKVNQKQSNQAQQAKTQTQQKPDFDDDVPF